MTESPRFYAGRTGAERADLRRAGFVHAAISLIAEDGWRALTVERVARRAGISRRYFYESFSSLDSLAGAVIDHLGEELSTALVAEDLFIARPELIGTMIRTLVQYAVDNPGRARVLMGEMAATDTAAKRRVVAVRRLVDVLAADGRTLHHADDPMIDIAASLLLNGTFQTLLAWLDGTITASQDEFADHLAALWLITTEGAVQRIATRR